MFLQLTKERLKKGLFWPGMTQDVYREISSCDVCQINKSENVKSPGLLKPLPIPTKIWCNISMDFVEGLPKSEGKDVILVVVDPLTKYAHFLPLSHPFSASQVAKLFLDHIYKLQGLPQSIVTDRDKILTSHLWKEMFQKLGTSLQYSTSYHPQTLGQPERVNQCL